MAPAKVPPPAGPGGVARLAGVPGDGGGVRPPRRGPEGVGGANRDVLLAIGASNWLLGGEVPKGDTVG